MNENRFLCHRPKLHMVVKNASRITKQALREGYSMKKRILAAVLLCVVVLGTVFVVRHVRKQKEAVETSRKHLMGTLEVLETREIRITK